MVKSYLASSLKEALDLRASETLTPYCGGTDLMIKADPDAGYLFLNKVPELKGIADRGDHIAIGAACTFTDLIQSDLIPQILKDAASQIAAPAIRNMGTIGGNIGNGSPKADTALIFFVCDAKLRLASANGERVMPIKDFYLGRNKLALNDDELIVEVLIPKTGLDNYYYKKIGARKALAIARVSFAALLRIEDGTITNCATAYGAISDVILRREDIDAMLIGKTIEQAKALKADYLAAYSEAIQPIPGRISAQYRKDVCMNLLNDFLQSNGI